MRFRLLRALLWRDRLRDAGERARREHSAFLTQALRNRIGVRHPRIPTRRVDRGGFDRLMADPRGRDAADRWWSSAFIDDD
jgi:hypothetical protein